jgi:hypothetical protein
MSSGRNLGTTVTRPVQPLTGGSDTATAGERHFAYRGWGTIRIYGFGDFQPPG